MSIIGIWDTKELEKWMDNIERLAQEEIDKFMERTIKEIAARTLAKLITNTPVGEYSDKDVKFTAYKGTDKEKEVSFTAKSNKVGGTLRRGWTAGSDRDPYEFIMNDISVIKSGDVYKIILSNPVNYASFVNYGHRTPKRADGSRGWVEGEFFLEASEDEIQEELPALLEKKLQKFLEEHLT